MLLVCIQYENAGELNVQEHFILPEQVASFWDTHSTRNLRECGTPQSTAQHTAARHTFCTSSVSVFSFSGVLTSRNTRNIFSAGFCSVASGERSVGSDVL